MRWSYLPALLLLGSCASSRWDAYDSSSYDVVMEPSQEEFDEHIALLEEWANDESKVMPPGLYIELGYWLAKVGRTAEAREAFDHELANYPYAEKYLTALMALVLASTESEGAEPEDAAPATSEAEDAVTQTEEQVQP